jgi:hypothetical protein
MQALHKMGRLATILATMALAVHGQQGDPTGPLEIRALGNGWVLSEGQATVANITPEEARRLALERARHRAIEFAVGVDVQAQRYLRREEEGKDAFLTVSEQTSAGRIAEEKTPEWEQYLIPGDGHPLTVLRVRLQVKVEEEKGEPDPDFQVHVELNKQRYLPGEEMVVAVTATKECYVTVLCVTASDTVIVLLPHQYRSERGVAPGDTLWLPDRDERAIGIRYRVALSPDRVVSSERIKVVATRGPHLFGQGLERVSLYNQVPTHQAALVELMRWMTRIPRNQRAEALVMYEVRRSE